MSVSELQFEPIDLDRHVDVFLAFIRDTHLCSFGSMEGFRDGNGRSEERFIERVRTRLAEEPGSCLHVWRNGGIVGQLHLGRFVDPTIGYINMFYVSPGWRGTGVASAMEDYACSYLQARGFQSAYLSVAAQNHRAIRFYEKQGWTDLGPRPDKPGTHNMEKRFALSLNQEELMQRINERLPAKTWRQYRSLVRKLHAETLTPEEHRILLSLTEEIEMDHARRLGLILELAHLRGTSLETQMRELRFPRHLYKADSSRSSRPGN